MTKKEMIAFIQRSHIDILDQLDWPYRFTYRINLAGFTVPQTLALALSDDITNTLLEKTIHFKLLITEEI